MSQQSTVAAVEQRQPTVSVIVPSYNMGRFLRATLDSILVQDHRPLEVVVTDGGSADDTVAILQEYESEHPELKWVSEPDDGPADAINKGLAMITGEIAAIQSADDIYYPGAIRAAVAAFADHPEASIVYADTEMIDVDGNCIWISRYLPFTIPRYLCGSTFIPQSSAFFRPDLARALGGVRTNYFVFDVDLWLRMMFRAPALKVDGVWSAYRRHAVQRDKQTSNILSDWRRMLDESPEIARGSWRVRRAARAAGHMLVQHYNPSGDPRYRAGQIWLAILIYPPVIRALRSWKLLLAPSPTVRGALRRLRRSITSGGGAGR